MLLASPERLVLEFQAVALGLHWDPSQAIRLDGVLAGDLAVDLDASTAAGWVTAGQVIRLVLRRVSPPAGAPVAPRLLQVGPDLVVILRPTAPPTP